MTLFALSHRKFFFARFYACIISDMTETIIIHEFTRFYSCFWYNALYRVLTRKMLNLIRRQIMKLCRDGNYVNNLQDVKHYCIISVAGILLLSQIYSCSLTYFSIIALAVLSIFVPPFYWRTYGKR